jgi:hypothetical protein
MNPSIIEIHEFSTGIRPQQIANGGWVSLGFTGQYMNVTIERIPDVVERSIANREFAVAEGASSDQPAIIGRVLGTGEDTWSVVAVVTRGRDEKGRSASMYRYFLTQGSEGYQNLRLILAWWESQEIPLTFNPFDLREMGKPNLCNVDETSTQFRKPSSEAIAIPVNTPEPILLTPQQQYDLQALNTLAFKKYNANKNGQAISWAFNVEALEKPERFLVIQAASDRAYQILQKAISNTPKVLPPASVTDEEAIKSVIRGLMNSSQVKLENVKVIADALTNKQITSAYWHTLFDGQGATTASSQKIYSPQMVRLITLRAMVIPETLPNFLAYLNIKGTQKPDDNQTVSLEFQSAISNQLSKDQFLNGIKEQFANGIKFILPKLLEQEITPESVHWLIMVKGSAWFTYLQEFTKDVKSDLELIEREFQSSNIAYSTPQSSLFADSLKCGNIIWNQLIEYHKMIRYQHGYSQPYYQPLAELFQHLGNYSLSAYFYQVSEGLVPKDVFNKAFPNSSEYASRLGIRIYPKISLIEKIWIFILRNYAYIAIFWGTLIIIGFVFVLVLEYRSKISQNTLIKSQLEMTEEKISNALEKDNFKTTINSVNGIVTSLQKDKTKPSIEKIRGVISQVICTKEKNEPQQCFAPESFNLIIGVKPDENNSDKKNKLKEDFVKQIYEYQKNMRDKNIDPDGIIGNNTKKYLENDVKETLGIVLPDHNVKKTNPTISGELDPKKDQEQKLQKKEDEKLEKKDNGQQL